MQKCMMTIEADVEWSDSNFTCSWYDGGGDAVMAVAETYELLKENFEDSLAYYVECCGENGVAVPDEMRAGEYKVIYNLYPSALLHVAGTYVKMKALGGVTGIHPGQLSRYASGADLPHREQEEKIKMGLRMIAESLLCIV